MTTHALSRSEFEPPPPLPARAELPSGRSLESMRLGSLHGRSMLPSTPSTPSARSKPSSLPYVAGLFLVVAIVAGLAGYTSIVELRGIDLAGIGVSGATLSAAGVAGLARIICVASAALFVITVAADILRRR